MNASHGACVQGPHGGHRACEAPHCGKWSQCGAMRRSSGTGAAWAARPGQASPARTRTALTHVCDNLVQRSLVQCKEKGQPEPEEAG